MTHENGWSITPVMSGARPAAVQRILRHTDPKMTLDVYAHLTPEHLRSEIDWLQE